MTKTFLRLSRGLEYGICFKPRWPPYWNPKWLPFQALFQHILAVGAVRNIIVAAVLGHSKHFPMTIWRSSVLDMLEPNMAAILESKMAAISAFISTYLGF